MSEKLPELDTPLEMSSDVGNAFDAFPPVSRPQFQAIRTLIFEVARENPEIGELTEALKWGQPSYLTEKSKSGTTVRLGCKKGTDTPALFVTCHTSLLDEFKTFYPDDFDYEGNRALILREPVEQVRYELKHCIALALTYQNRRKRGKPVA